MDGKFLLLRGRQAGFASPGQRRHLFGNRAGEHFRSTPIRSVAFVKDFAPDYSSNISSTVPLHARSVFPLRSLQVQLRAANVQYGFETIGPNVLGGPDRRLTKGFRPNQSRSRAGDCRIGRRFSLAAIVRIRAATKVDVLRVLPAAASGGSAARWAGPCFLISYQHFRRAAPRRAIKKNRAETSIACSLGDPSPKGRGGSGYETHSAYSGYCVPGARYARCQPMRLISRFTVDPVTVFQGFMNVSEFARTRRRWRVWPAAGGTGRSLRAVMSRHQAYASGPQQPSEIPILSFYYPSPPANVPGEAGRLGCCAWPHGPLTFYVGWGMHEGPARAPWL